MPKIVDHAQRRDEIALVACRVVAQHGFDGASMVRIAHEAGYTTGMLAHYFDTKQDIIIAALRLILRRIEERLTQPAARGGRPDLLALLTEALPGDEHFTARVSRRQAERPRRASRDPRRPRDGSSTRAPCRRRRGPRRAPRRSPASARRRRRARSPNPCSRAAAPSPPDRQWPPADS